MLFTMSTDPLSDGNSKLRALLFDFGGVIAEEGFRDGLYRIAGRQGLDREMVYRAGVDAVYSSGFCLGWGSEADFWAEMRRSFPLPEDDATMTREILARFVLRRGMVNTVRRYRAAGYVCGLLSDHTTWLDELDARDGFYKEFDRLYISYRLGKGKRDATLFDDVIKDLGHAPQQIAFTDDDPGHVQRANTRGMQAFVFADEFDCQARLAKLTGSGERERA